MKALANKTSPAKNCSTSSISEIVSAHLTFSLPNIEKRGQSNIQEKDEQKWRGSMQHPTFYYEHVFV
tara:strand:+ start:465 stop:665 length:201 start_codon:yes stop_codon:yes gene_type:complete